MIEVFDKSPSTGPEFLKPLKTRCGSNLETSALPVFIPQGLVSRVRMALLRQHKPTTARLIETTTVN